MGKKPKAIEVKPEWFDEELEAAAKAREATEWQEWEKQMVIHYSGRRVGGILLAKALNARRAKDGLPPRTVSCVRSAISRFAER